MGNLDPRDIWRFVVTLLVGIGLTVIALPTLLVATCIPFLTGEPHLSTRIFYVGFGLVCGTAGLVAAFARNEGTRWGAIALLALLAIGLAYCLVL